MVYRMMETVNNVVVKLLPHLIQNVVIALKLSGWGFSCFTCIINIITIILVIVIHPVRKLLIFGNCYCPTPDRVRAVEEPWLTIEDKPVALVKSNVAALVIAEIERFSRPDIDEGVTDALITAISSSVPSPPSKRSPEFRVCKLPVLKPASKVTLPEVPVKLFEPVVSGLILEISKQLIYIRKL